MSYQTPNLYSDAVNRMGDYLCFHFDDDRFTGIQALLGISPIPPFPDALEWVVDREHLLSEEQAYWDTIGQPQPYCRFELVKHSWGQRSLAYESTSGTILVRSESNRKDLAIVMLPLKRKLGHHYRLLSLCEYLPVADINYYENIHLLPAVERSQARVDRSTIYDGILVRRGFQSTAATIEEANSSL